MLKHVNEFLGEDTLKFLPNFLLNTQFFITTTINNLTGSRNSWKCFDSFVFLVWFGDPINSY